MLLQKASIAFQSSQAGVQEPTSGVTARLEPLKGWDQV